MTFELRPYQIRALDAVYEDLKTHQEVLLQGIMGAGKSFIAVTLIKRLYHENPGMNFLLLMHKQELVDQFYKAFKDFTDISLRSIGICCAGLKQKIIDRQVTIASIQTFVGMKEKYLGASLIVVDEAHRIDINGATQYKETFDYLRLQRPNSRIFGITATVGRLNHGFIYGSKCMPGASNLFQKVSARITYEELKKEGYLVPLKGMVAAHDSLEKDLAGIANNSEYVLNEVGEIMSRELHIETAVEAIEKYCGDYKCVCCFCCTISHAEKLQEAIGDTATIVHSKLSSIERQANMMSWISGEKRIITSVTILTEGFDLPRLDCLVFARPTLSSTLWLQAVGRVLRTCEGKDHGFLLDLTDTTSRMGTDLDNVKITIPKSVEKEEAKIKSMYKICPSCELEVLIALRECPECGFAWEPAECVVAQTLPEMKEVVFKKLEPVWFDVDSFEIEIHESKKSQKLLGKVIIHYWEGEYRSSRVFLWLCFADYYSGFAVTKAKEKWGLISADNFPANVEDFMESQLMMIDKVLLDTNGKYPEIVDIKCKSSICEPIMDDNSYEFKSEKEYDDLLPF